jgi:prepilin-type N-terminal cleavage/methylation domain-containing protein
MKTKDTYLKAPLIKGDVWKTGGFWAYAFTLVELIVVITILAILWTIAFLSFQWYNRSARDSVRTSDIKNIEQWLWVMIAKSWIVPTPDDNKITLTASWTVIWYQWYAWKQVQNAIWMSANWWKDPLDLNYYTYSTNANKTKYQLLWFLEWGVSKSEILWKSYAIDYSNRFITTRWSDIWILLWNSWTILNQPIQENWSWSIDLKTTIWNYKVNFTSWDTITWSWNQILTIMSIYDKTISNLDDSLVWYWDMETITMSWSQVLLKDLSKYWNNWVCYNGISIVSCWNWLIWPKFIKSSLKNYITLNGVSDFIKVTNNNSINFSTWDLSIVLNFSSQFLSPVQWIILKWNWPFNLDWSWIELRTQWNWAMEFCLSSWVWICPRINLNINDLRLKLSEKGYFSIIIVSDRLNRKLNFYVNWVLYSQANFSPDFNDTFDLSIWRWNDWYLTWDIYMLKLYNKKLTQQEIQTLYNATK